jgi:hypothetical protein
MRHISCLLLLPGIVHTAYALIQPPLRAGYQFTYGMAWSAGVELPAYAIHDLGAGFTPLAINDALTVLLQGPDETLIRWRGGNREVLSAGVPATGSARLNESGSVFMLRGDLGDPPELAFWSDDRPDPEFIQLTPHLLPDFTSATLYALNDQDQCLLRMESADAHTPFPPHIHRIETNRLDARQNTWSTLCTYEYRVESDFSFRQEGTMYQVNDSNNYGESVGEVYRDSASAPPFSDELQFGLLEQYFAHGIGASLDFEPMALNDRGSIAGRSPGPLHGLVIQDTFGQREVGGYLDGFDETRALMSDPRDGFEEIVVGNHYFRRKSERDLFGQPNGRPSPDFWQGTLAALVGESDDWSALHATAISAGGRIAGVGRHTDPLTGEASERAFLLVPQALLPDWDRDGRIDPRDHRHAARRLPWRFWINDDDDAGELARSAIDDLPGSDTPDWQSPGIDGLRDVVDFFPVHLDLQAMLRAHPDPARVEITLSQEDAALNMVYTRLHPDELHELLDGAPQSGFGSGMSEPLAAASTVPISPGPVALDPAFIDSLRADNRGVLLFEGTGPTSKPLVMEFRYDGQPIITWRLPLSIGPVRDMLRVVNLRQADEKFADAPPGPWETRLADPPNLPDAQLRAIGGQLRTLVHLHGFNWSGDEVPAAHAELFKRFFQTGSQARFIGVSWRSDQGTLELLGTSFDYNENVVNAFVTVRLLKDALAGFGGPLTSLFAHSLGNMVASSAIADFGLDVAQYFMLNAAVPNEAYLGEQDDRRLMVHPDWKDRLSVTPDYAEWLHPSNWGRLFISGDQRARLGWKDRFAGLSANLLCVNFHSTGEDVLQSGDGAIPNLIEKVWKREQVWVYNEMNKGTTALSTSLSGDIHGGWAFNRHYMSWQNPGGGAHGAGEWVPMSTVDAGSLDPAGCVVEPFFRPFSAGDPDFPDWGDGQWLYQDFTTANARLPGADFSQAGRGQIMNHAKVLAEGIPATSPAAGATPLPSLFLLNNHDMDSEFRRSAFWPDRDNPAQRDRWLHSDYLNAALGHVSGLFLKSVEYINHANTTPTP